jgi:hypothetical protein
MRAGVGGRRNGRFADAVAQPARNAQQRINWYDFIPEKLLARSRDVKTARESPRRSQYYTYRRSTDRELAADRPRKSK